VEGAEPDDVRRHEAFIDGYLRSAVDFGEQIDEETDIFFNALSVAYGEDTILLDTVHKSPDGEYEAYLPAVKYGELHETCASFSAAIAKGRAEIGGPWPRSGWVSWS
jgi:hypothetical protein